MRTPRIAVCHPSLEHGGSEARALWLVHGLAEMGDVDLLTLRAVDVDALSTYYGVPLRERPFTVRRPTVMRNLTRMHRGDGLRAAAFERFVAGRASRYDLVISAYNPMPIPGRSIAYVADVSWHPELRRALFGDTSLRDGARGAKGIVSGAYGALERALRPGAVVGAQRIVANSHYVADLLAEHTAIQCASVIYPPVAGPPARTDTTERSPTSFVMLGRLAPEKRIEEQIRILERVRAEGFDVNLRILGGGRDAVYAQALEREHEAPWIAWAGWVGGASKWDALASARFGIHGCRGEAFGISVAEMMRAGVIPFAPTEGGPAELLGEDRLVYGSEDEAVRKITALLASEAEHAGLREDLQRRGEAFGVEAFLEASLALVDDVLAAPE